MHSVCMHSWNLFRAVMVVVIVLLVSPVLAGAVVDGGQRETIETDFGGRESVLFVTAQGTERTDGAESKAMAIDTATGNITWRHDSYYRYFDVEPLDDRRVLFLGAASSRGADMWTNVVDWRTGETLTRFRVPHDTHDIDALGDGRYAVADKEDHRLYVYDSRTNETVWEYRYANHYPDSAGGDSDYTHVNDIDSVDNGSAFLSSPRNFDRVTLVDRETKAVVWTLGEEDNYEILHEQHNPVLLTRDPPTVLVADSENDRVVEYTRTSDGWEQVWAYRGSMRWPRDADRLPNGNTLVVDSHNHRVLEVTPDREVVWELPVRMNTYDADLLSTGEEPDGPPMREFRDEFDGARAPSGQLGGILAGFEFAVELLYWVVPWHVTLWEFLSLLSAAGLGVFWTGTELSWRAERTGGRSRLRLPTGTGAFPVAGIAVGTGLPLAPDLDAFAVPVWRGFGGVLWVLALLSVPDRWLSTGPLGSVGESRRSNLRAVVATAAVAGSLALAFATALTAFYLAVGTLFALEGTRRVSVAGERHGDRIGLGYVLGGYLVRAAALVPVVVLFYITRAPAFSAIYLGLAVVLLGTVALPHTNSRGTEEAPPSFIHWIRGGRTVVVVVSLVAMGSLAVSAVGSASLAGPYVALVVLLARTVALLVGAPST